MRTHVQERLLGGLGAAIVVLMLGYLLLVGMIVEVRRPGDRSVTVLGLDAPPLPPRRPRPHLRPPHARRPPAPAAPRALRNKASEIVTPPPPITPVPPPIVSAPQASAGAAAFAGASDRPGPGEGAGGRGNGEGGGGDGDGEGDGGTPPRLISGRLKFSDLPADLRAADVGGTVTVRYGVELDGRVGDCLVTGSSGSAELDAATCTLIQQRFRFRPSRDREGRPVRSRIEERHSWVVEPAMPPRR